MRHNIVSGTVTHHRDHTPAKKIVKRVVIVIAALFAAFLAFGFILLAVQDEPAKRSTPVCEVEDGSTQERCIFRGSDGKDYVNHNFGEWWEVHPR